MDLYRKKFDALIAYACAYRQRTVTLIGIEYRECVAMTCDDPETVVLPMPLFERYIAELNRRFRLARCTGTHDWIVTPDGELGAITELRFSVLETRN